MGERDSMNVSTDLSNAFTLTLHSWGGPELGSDAHERESRLVLSSHDQRAFLEKHRSESDAEGEPIGTFEATLEPTQFDELSRLVDSVHLRSMPEGRSGGMGVTTYELTIERQDMKYDKRLSSMDIELLEKLEPLFEKLYEIQATLEKHPLSALKISLRHEGNVRGGRFVLTLTNIGLRSLYMTDPRSLPQQDDEWAGVQIAVLPTEIPGVTSPPLEWESLYAEKPGSELEPKELRLESGQSIVFKTADWAPSKSGVTYIAQGVFSSYQGPQEIDGVYFVRGAIFSEAIEIPF